MYYLGIKVNDDLYDLTYLDFHFDDLKEMFEFVKSILKYSNYEIVIQNCVENDEE